MAKPYNKAPSPSSSIRMKGTKVNNAQKYNQNYDSSQINYPSTKQTFKPLPRIATDLQVENALKNMNVARSTPQTQIKKVSYKHRK